MNLRYFITILFSLFALTNLFAQTTGFNYQALILNANEIQIPGTDVVENQVPLGLEEVTFRFSILNENGVEYVEEQSVTTDESGLVSLIVGDGIPINSTFDDIVWDGEIKYLHVEIDILNDDESFVVLDHQKILYLPHPGLNRLEIAESVDDLSDDNQTGDLIWVKNFGESGESSSLMIWNGTQWEHVNKDFETDNELGLVVASHQADRDTLFGSPKIGDQVWNQACQCIEVFDGNRWVAITQITASNGLTREEDTIKLGGSLLHPTVISTSTSNPLAIQGLDQSSSIGDQVVMVEENSSFLRKKNLNEIVRREEFDIVANDGQLRFPTPLPITNINKIDVYRNGIRIDFVAVDTQHIEIDPEAICFQNDEIRIIQLY